MNIKQLKSQSLLQEALQEALCELGDTRLRNLTITKVELSAGKESAKVFLDENSLEGAESARILSALKKASGIIRANISAQLSWYKVPNLRFEVDKDLAQMNRLDEIFKKINNKGSAESSVDSVEKTQKMLDSADSQNLGENISSLRDSAKQNRGNPSIKKTQNLVKNNSVRSTQTRPLRGAKNQNQASSSGKANFLLEAEKRGSPPKSEKRQLLGTHLNNSWGERGVGAALLRKEKDSKENAESNRDSSPKAQNDKFRVRVAESSVDSADSATRAKIAESTTNFNKENPK